jgi:DNA-binding transcriptional regulator YiaG
VVLVGLNEALCGKFEEHFVTAAYLYADLDAKIVRYAGAGHPPILFSNRSNSEVRSIEQTGGEMAKAKKIKVNIYDDMRRSLPDALAYQRGQEVDLRVTTIPAPPKRLKPQEIRHIRESLHASQAIFAHFLCLSSKAV